MKGALNKPEADITRIHRLIRAYRGYVGMTQTEFGAKYGVSHASISDIENGKTQYLWADIINDVLTWLMGEQTPSN